MEQAPEAPLLYSVEDAARLLGIDRSTVYRLIEKGELHRSKIGRRTLIDRDEIQRFREAAKDAA